VRLGPWLLELKNGKPTGFGTEKTILKLNFGGGKTLTGKSRNTG